MEPTDSEIHRTTIDNAGFNREIEGTEPTTRAAEARSFVKFHTLISKSLWSGAILTVLMIVAGALWGILHAVRDGAGAAGTKGVFLVIAVCWILNLVTLIVLTAICQLRRIEDENQSESGDV